MHYAHKGKIKVVTQRNFLNIKSRVLKHNTYFPAAFGWFYFLSENGPIFKLALCAPPHGFNFARPTSVHRLLWASTVEDLFFANRYRYASRLSNLLRFLVMIATCMRAGNDDGGFWQRTRKLLATTVENCHLNCLLICGRVQSWRI